MKRWQSAQNSGPKRHEHPYRHQFAPPSNRVLKTDVRMSRATVFDCPAHSNPDLRSPRSGLSTRSIALIDKNDLIEGTTWPAELMTRRQNGIQRRSQRKIRGSRGVVEAAKQAGLHLCDRQRSPERTKARRQGRSNIPTAGRQAAQDEKHSRGSSVGDTAGVTTSWNATQGEDHLR